MAKKDNKELLIKLRKRYTVMRDADEDNRRAALDDMKFIHVPDGLDNGGGSNGSSGQWEENMRLERGKRPCYTFNKLRVTMKRIINDIRANTPSAKVRGVEGGDVKTAETFEGLIRNILNVSDFDTIIDGAAQYMVSAGMGAWRIDTDWSKSNPFAQDITLQEIMNPFCLYSDPSAKDALKIKARDWILTEKIPETDYKARYPKAEVIDFGDTEFDDDEDWEGDEVRIAEYWYKEPTSKEIFQLVDGRIIDEDEAVDIPPEMIKDQRTLKTDKIMMCIASGNAILEGPTEWAGSIFPFITCYGEHFVADGAVYWYGAGRWAKDAQRSYNVSRTAITETIAQAPQAKFWTTAKQAEGQAEKWAEAHKKNFPFLTYNPDPLAPGPPQRMGGADIPIALIQESQIASEEINMTTGRYQNDVGAPNPANSGKQELIRNNQGDLATYNYPDNMGKSIQRTWEILIDLIPKVYDTERSLRILGADGAEDYVTINTVQVGQNGEEVPANDLSVGEYDVTVTIGPSFSTKRQEAADTYQQLMQGNPEIFGVAGDLIFKAMDAPYADEISERLKALLPPQIQEMINKDKEIPPEVQQMMEQAKQAMELVQQQAQEVQAAAEALAQEQATAQAESSADKAEVEKAIANLKTEQANFKALIATETAKLKTLEASLTIKGYDADAMEQQGSEKMEAISELASNMAQAMESIQGTSAQFNVNALGAIADMLEQTKKPLVKKIVSKRENGQIVAVPEYEETVQ